MEVVGTAAVVVAEDVAAVEDAMFVCPAMAAEAVAGYASYAEEEARRIAERAEKVVEKQRAVGPTLIERISEKQAEASREDEDGVGALSEAINKELHLGGEVASGESLVSPADGSINV